MTCIVGLSHKGKVWIGGDSAGSSEGFMAKRKDKKVFKKDGFIIGFAGSFRFGDILKYKYQFPKRGKISLEKYFVCDFIDGLRECINTSGLKRNSEDGPEEMESGMLIGTEGRLFSIDSDFQVAEPSDGIYCIGSGSEYSFGAMFIEKVSNKFKDPKKSIINSLKAASYWNPGQVSAPYTVLENS